MKYSKFIIQNYRAINGPLEINLASRLVPLVGVNECGKTTILQAIFCFDHHNDKENAGRHLTSLENLYETTSSGVPTIGASIKCDKSDLIKILDSYTAELNKKLAANPADAADAEQQQDISKRIESLSALKKSMPDLNEIELLRDLKSKNYSCTTFSSLDSFDENLMCRNVVSSMPYTLYNDDFNDRPIDRINLTAEEKDDWYDIYNRVFMAANKGYSLKKLISENELRRKSIIKEVEMYLGNTLTKGWAKFSPERKTISIELEYKESIENKSANETTILIELYVRVVETQSGSAGRFFSITDRSKGFIWYYNFIMKIMFNPKQAGTPKETIFLLDEPGSYLHEVAQSSLCEKLSDISGKEGIVIYCTHSPQLLNPKYVSLNAALIISKTKKHLITATPISSKNMLYSRKNTALQPIYDALMIPEYEKIYANEKILCVEGIYDKYCIECFCELPSDIRLFPSTNAESIISNIQYFIAYQKEYMALWDNDDEGNMVFNKAKKYYGDMESLRFSLLPNVSSKNKTEMEDMIEATDFALLSIKLGFNGSTKYEAIVSALYFMNKTERTKITSDISDKTKQNFAILTKIIDRILIHSFSTNEMQEKSNSL